MKQLTFHVTDEGWLMFSDDDCCWWYCHFQPVIGGGKTAVAYSTPSINVKGRSQLGIDLICKEFQENYI
jgi:hypothetical protein